MRKYRTRFWVTLSLFILPLVCVLIIYNIYSVNALNRHVAENSQSASFLYARPFSESLHSIQSYLVNELANNGDMLRLNYPLEPLTAYLCGYDIASDFSRMLATNIDGLVALSFYSEKNDLTRISYAASTGYSSPLETRIRTQVTADMKQEDSIERGWYTAEIGGHYFLIRIFRYGSVTVSAVLDFDSMLKPQDEGGSDSAYLVYATREGTVLTADPFVKENGIELELTDRQYYITGHGRSRFLVVSYELADMDLVQYYITPWFARYTRVIVEKLSDRVRCWMTLNEPQCHILIGHLLGDCAPKLKLSYPQPFSAMHNHLLAHGKAVMTIRKYAKLTPKIGTAFCTGETIPATDSPADVEAARKAAFDAGDRNLWSGSWWFDPVILGKYPEEGIKAFGDDFPQKLLRKEDMEIISQPLDFLGVNVYRGSIVKADGKGGCLRVKMKTGYARTAFKWPVTPQTLYYTPKFLYERYHLPILITENGLSSMDWPSLDGKVHDMQRIDFMHRYLKCLQSAVNDGIEVLGYFTWSFMDNMEWSNGYSERFGIVYVDFETQERILKDSAYWYHDTILQNGENL